MGDRYYKNREYPLARIEYDRAIDATVSAQPDCSGSKNNCESSRDSLRAKSALTMMRESRYRDSLHLLEGSSFPILYLRMFASLKGGFRNRFLLDQGDILASNANPEQKDLARLLGGTLYLEDGDYAGARDYFARVQKDTDSSEIRNAAGATLTAMDKYEELPRKKPWVAGILSGLVPGAGQMYSRNVADGLTAFGFTTVFCGSAAYMNSLETKAGRSHTGSLITGVIGLGFYLVNITGGVASAQRFNNYHERKFQQEIRDRFFNIDFIEKTSGINFEINF